METVVPSRSLSLRLHLEEGLTWKLVCIQWRLQHFDEQTPKLVVSRHDRRDTFLGKHLLQADELRQLFVEAKQATAWRGWCPGEKRLPLLSELLCLPPPHTGLCLVWAVQWCTGQAVTAQEARRRKHPTV